MIFLQNVTQVFDLDLFDGIASAISISNNAPSHVVYVDLAAGPDSAFDLQKSEIADVFGGASLPSGQIASGKVIGTGSLQTLETVASGSASNTTQLNYGSRYTASALSSPWQFVLTPHTQVVFAAFADMQLSTLAMAYENAYTFAGLRVADYPFSYVQLPTATPDSGQQDVLDGLSLTRFSVDGGTESAQRALSATFTNMTDHDLIGYLGAQAFVDGFSAVSPVPMPAEWVLMLGGLGLIGGCLRKRASLVLTSHPLIQHTEM